MRYLLPLALILGMGSSASSDPQPDPEPARCDSGPVAAEYNSVGTSGARDPSCRDASRALWKAPRPAGSKCKQSTDCAPVCCACPTSGRSALTSWCRDGVCTSPEPACCALLGTPTLS